VNDKKTLYSYFHNTHEIIPTPIKYFLINNTIWMIASSCEGKVEHFAEVLENTKAEAALAAWIFHREEMPIEAAKNHMREKGIETR